MTTRRTELRAVLIGLAAALVLVAAQAGIGAQHRMFGGDPSAREQASACLGARGLAVAESGRDPIAATASGGAVSTVVEGNPVTISFVGSDREAARLVKAYSTVAAGLRPPQLQARGYFVSIWSGAPTSVQLQTVYDCTV